MEQQDAKLPLEWLSSRRTPELHRLEQLCRETAREQRCTQRRLQEVEEAMAAEAEGLGPGTGAAAGAPGPQTQLEQLSRKLSAANAELRRYETRMFAYERTMLALRKENAELTARCDELRKELDHIYVALQQPEMPLAQAGLTRSGADGQPELPVIHFPQTASGTERPAQPSAKPRTKLEHLSDEVLARLAQLMPRQE